MSSDPNSFPYITLCKVTGAVIKPKTLGWGSVLLTLGIRVLWMGELD